MLPTPTQITLWLRRLNYRHVHVPGRFPNPASGKVLDLSDPASVRIIGPSKGEDVSMVRHPHTQSTVVNSTWSLSKLASFTYNASGVEFYN